MIDEGYVKFSAHWTKGPAPTGIAALIDARNHLFQLGLVGEYAELKIGYGNVSQISPDRRSFVISGSATGGKPIADAKDFCIVRDYDLNLNTVDCIGPVTASSESMTHAMLYACSKEIGAILHVHHRGFWENLLWNAPTTSADVAYGTPEMAFEMKRLWENSELPTTGILAMAGHEEGIVAVGKNVGEVLKNLEEKWYLWGGN
jgi:L-ribulose-5-phosphate 4-epimerase